MLNLYHIKLTFKDVKYFKMIFFLSMTKNQVQTTKKKRDNKYKYEVYLFFNYCFWLYFKKLKNKIAF